MEAPAKVLFKKAGFPAKPSPMEVRLDDDKTGIRALGVVFLSSG